MADRGERGRERRGRVDAETFVDHIRCFPYLWDPKHPQFKDGKLKEKRWVAIAQHFEVGSAAMAQRKWINLRDRYMKEKRKYLKKVISDGEAAEPSNWKLFKKLSAILEARKSGVPLSTTTMLEGTGEQSAEYMQLPTLDMEVHDDSENHNGFQDDLLTEVTTPPTPSSSEYLSPGPCRPGAAQNRKSDSDFSAAASKITSTLDSIANRMSSQVEAKKDDIDYYFLCLAQRMRRIRSVDPSRAIRLQLKLEQMFCEDELQVT